MHHSPIRIGLSLLLIAISIAATSQNRYVNPTTGSDLGPNDCSLPGSPCQTIGHAITQSAANDIINLAAGTYPETIVIDRALTLSGSNQGMAGNAPGRGAEAIIEPASPGNIVEIDSDNVTIDGVQIGSTNADVGVFAVNNTGITVTNSVINADSVGISFLTATTGSIDISNNLITMSDFTTTATSTTTSGVALSGLTGSVDVNLSNNDYSGGSHGIFVFNCLSSNILTVTNDTVANATRGSSVFSFDGTSRASTSINFDGFSVSNMAEPVSPIPGFPETGIYFYTDGSSTDSHIITSTINNSSFSGADNTTSDYAGVICGDFSSTDYGAFLQDITITESTFSNNDNRGIYVRGQNTTASIDRSTFLNNGYDPTGSGGNPGFHIVVRNNATVTASNCFFTNPGVQTSDQFDGLGIGIGGSLSITESNFNQNGNGRIVQSTVSGIDLSNNYFGSIDEATISGFIGNNDFTPWIASGTDTDLVTEGFQPNMSTLHVGTSGSQTGATGRWQEGHDLVNASGMLIQSNGDYSETVTVSKNITFQPASGAGDTSLDDLIINGTGITMNLEGNLLINSSATLTDGNINVSSGELRLGTSASDLSESASGQLTGRLTMDTRAVGTGNINLLGVNITGTEDLGNVTIVRSTGASAVVSGGSDPSITVIWDITSSNSPAGNRDISFSWRSQFDNGLSMLNISAFRNNGANWIKVSPSGTNVSGSDPRVLIVNNVTSFSEWTMAPDDAALPVVLSHFGGIAHEGKVILNWTTMVEINSDYFEIQKSFDGINFSKIATVKSNGNTNRRIDYEWMDHSLINPGVVYYRLKMVDFDGTSEYSHTIALSSPLSSQLSLYPNPAQNFLKIDYWKSPYFLSIYDQSGKLILSELTSQFNIPVSHFERGVYFIQVDSQPLKRIVLD